MDFFYFGFSLVPSFKEILNLLSIIMKEKKATSRILSRRFILGDSVQNENIENDPLYEILSAYMAVRMIKANISRRFYGRNLKSKDIISQLSWSSSSVSEGYVKFKNN